MTVRATAGDTVDAVCYRHLGRTRGATEAVLEANPGLADHGPMLPPGLSIAIPDSVENASPATRTYSLWD